MSVYAVVTICRAVCVDQPAAAYCIASLIYTKRFSIGRLGSQGFLIARLLIIRSEGEILRVEMGYHSQNRLFDKTGILIAK